MEKPTECRYCGCSVRFWGPDTIFKCLTISHPRGEWSQSTECKLKSAEDRIQRAVEVLEGAARFDVIPWDGGVRRDPAVDGWETDSGILNQVIEILKGETDGKAD